MPQRPRVSRSLGNSIRVHRPAVGIESPRTLLHIVEEGYAVGNELKTQPDKAPTVQALASILDGLLSRSYRLVTVPDLLASCHADGC